MKVIGTFDGSASSESILMHLAKVARLPTDEVLLFSVIEPQEHAVRLRGALRNLAGVIAVQGTPARDGALDRPKAPEVSEAPARVAAERADYLHSLVKRLPVGPRYVCQTETNEDPACAIIQRALQDQPDLIVMATHGRTGLVHILFGDTAEEVVRSGVAPVLLVQPETVRDARSATRS